jgi:hypothetical protein
VLLINNNNQYVKLATSHPNFSTHEALRVGYSRNKIPESAERIWNKVAPYQILVKPNNPPQTGYSFFRTWESKKDINTDWKNACFASKAYIDAVPYLPFLFLAACGVSAQPLVEDFLEHFYFGVYEWLNHFYLDAEVPEHRVWFLAENLSERYFAESNLVEIKCRYLEQSRLYPNAALAENFVRRFKLHIDLVQEFWNKNYPETQWIKTLAPGEIIFSGLIEFTYTSFTDMGILPGGMVIKTEASKTVVESSKIFLKPQKVGFNLDGGNVMGLINTLGDVLDMLFSLIKSVEIEKETQWIVSSDDFRTSALSNL